MNRGAMKRSPGSDARFRRLYDNSFEPIRSYCIRRLPVSEVNDAVSDVFLVAWRRIDEVPQGEEARLWLYGIARNVVRNAERSRRRRARLQGRLESLSPTTGPTPESVVVRRAEDEEVLRRSKGCDWWIERCCDSASGSNSATTRSPGARHRTSRRDDATRASPQTYGQEASASNWSGAEGPSARAGSQRG